MASLQKNYMTTDKQIQLQLNDRGNKHFISEKYIPKLSLSNKSFNSLGSKTQFISENQSTNSKENDYPLKKQNNLYQMRKQTQPFNNTCRNNVTPNRIVGLNIKKPDSRIQKHYNSLMEISNEKPFLILEQFDVDGDNSIQQTVEDTPKLITEHSQIHRSSRDILVKEGDLEIQAHLNQGEIKMEKKLQEQLETHRSSDDKSENFEIKTGQIQNQYETHHNIQILDSADGQIQIANNSSIKETVKEEKLEKYQNNQTLSNKDFKISTNQVIQKSSQPINVTYLQTKPKYSKRLSHRDEKKIKSLMDQLEVKSVSSNFCYSTNSIDQSVYQSNQSFYQTSNAKFLELLKKPQTRIPLRQDDGQQFKFLVNQFEILRKKNSLQKQDFREVLPERMKQITQFECTSKQKDEHQVCIKNRNKTLNITVSSDSKISEDHLVKEITLFSEAFNNYKLTTQLFNKKDIDFTKYIKEKTILSPQEFMEKFETINKDKETILPSITKTLINSIEVLNKLTNRYLSLLS